MRLLVACSSCNRQYDATGYPIGSQFHCHCGELVDVAQPGAHEAAVVRCSGCGAPRGSGPTCGHCGSSFAAYERDMSSICPHCVSRVSDHARFCHSCGLALAAEGSAGELSEFHCPACEGGEGDEGEQRMHSRPLGPDLSLLECSRCAGLWLGTETFEHVIRRAEEMVANLDQGAAPSKPSTIAAQTVRYRPCPVCTSLMNRNQYGKFSRVIVDTCKQHGVWLDEGELSQILEWVRSGGLDQSRKAVHEARVQELRNQQFAATMASHREAYQAHGSEQRSLGDSLLRRLFF